MASVLLVEDFNDEALDASLSEGGAPVSTAFATDQVYEGSHSYKVVTADRDSATLYALSGFGARAAAADNVVLGAAIFIPSASAGEIDALCVAPATQAGSGYTYYTGLVIKADGSGEVRKTAGTITGYTNLWTGTVLGPTIPAGTFPADQWFFVEVDVVFTTDATGSVDVYLDGVSVYSESGIDTSGHNFGVLTQCRGALHLDTGSYIGNLDWWFDYLYVAEGQAPSGPPIGGGGGGGAGGPGSLSLSGPAIGLI